MISPASMIELTTEATRSRTALHHKGDQCGEQDDQRHRAHGQERTVPQRQEHTIVAKCHDFPDVLEQLKLARPTELEEGSLRARLGGSQKNEYERHDKNDANDDRERQHLSRSLAINFAEPS